MKKKIFLVLLSASVQLTYSIAASRTILLSSQESEIHRSAVVKNDTIVHDLGDLEAEMSAPELVSTADTASYGAPRQKNFNALNYVLDGRHRFKGDSYVPTAFWGNAFINVGAGVGGFYSNTKAASFTPTFSFRLAAGKTVSPMVSFRLGLEKSWAYSHASSTVFNTNQFNSYSGYVDFIYNFSNYLMGYRPERPFSVSGILGFGVQTANLHSWNNPDMTSVGASTSGTAVDGHVGVQFKFFASPYASVALEPYFKVATKKLNLLDNPGYSDPDFSYGVNFAYQWNFAKQLSDLAHVGVFWKRFDNHQRYLLNNGQLKHLRYPMFFDYSFGPMYVGKSDHLNWRNTRGFDALAAVGWWLAPAAGIRTGIHVTNGDWSANSFGSNPAKLLIGTRGVNFDFLFNPFGFKRQYNWDTPFGMNLLAGYEFGAMKKAMIGLGGSYEGNYSAFRLGGQFWMKLTNDLRLTLEPTYMQTEHYDGNLDRERYDEYAVKMGLSLLFRDKAIRNYQDVAEDSVQNIPQRGFFLGLGLGWNNTVWDWRFTGYQHDFLKNTTLFGGYHFNVIHGVRLQGEWMKESQAFFNGGGNNIGKFNYNNFLLSTDYQINLFNAMAGYDPLRRWNVYVYAGPTLLLGDGGAAFAANAGGMLTYNLSRDLSLFYSHTVYRMPKDRYPHHMVYSRDGIFSNNLNVGVIYNINHDNNIFEAASQRRLFFEYGFGPAYLGRIPLSMRNSRGFDANASVGWWFSSAFALRGGIHVTNADWQSDQYDNNPTKLLVGTRGVTADLMVNPFGFVKDYNWEQPFGFNLIGGYEFGHGKRTLASFIGSYEGNYDAYRAGVQLWARLANGLRLTLEPMYSSVRLKGVNGYNYNEYALKAGLAVLFKRQEERNYADATNDEVQNTPKKGYFLGVGMGWSNTVWDWRFSGHQHGVMKNATIFGGYHFNELHGIRLQSEWMREKIAFPGTNSLTDLKPNNYLLSFDYQFNLYNYMAGYNPINRWNVYLYGGPTLVMGDGGTKLAANVGGMITYNLTHDMSLFYSHTVYRMNKHHYPTSLVYTRDGTYTNNLNIGVMYSFDAFRNFIIRDDAEDPIRRPFFFEYSFGPTLMGKTPLSGFKTTGFDSKFLVGWWANSAVGVRSGVHVTNANWNEGAYGNDRITYLFGSRGALFDLLINPLGFVHQYNWDAPFGFNVFAGYEIGHAKKTNVGFFNSFEGNYHSYRFGGQLWAKLTNDLRLTLEPTFTPIKLSADDDNRHNQFSLNVGVSVLMRSKYYRLYDEKVSDEQYHNLPLQGFFVGGGLGWNTTVWRWKLTEQKSDFLKNAMLFAGYNFSTLHAIRLQGEGMREKIVLPGNTNSTAEHYNNFLLSLDYQLNAFNALAGFNPARRWNVYLIAGPSLVMGKGGLTGGFNVGGQVGYNISRNFSVFFSNTVYRMPKGRYPYSLPFTTNGTFTNNLNLGIMYSFK